MVDARLDSERLLSHCGEGLTRQTVKLKRQTVVSCEVVSFQERGTVVHVDM